jgi:hypothetical protein
MNSQRLIPIQFRLFNKKRRHYSQQFTVVDYPYHYPKPFPHLQPYPHPYPHYYPPQYPPPFFILKNDIELYH